jgi:hypothetical protein
VVKVKNKNKCEDKNDLEILQTEQQRVLNCFAWMWISLTGFKKLTQLRK